MRRRQRREPDFYDRIGLGQGAEKPPAGEITLDELAAASGDPAYSRAARAKALIEDELFVESVESVRSAYTDAWRRSKPGPEGASVRERLHTQLVALDDVLRVLHRVLREGQLTQAGGTSGGRAA